MVIREKQSVATDEMLIRRCSDGDETALNPLYQRYKSSIISYLYRLTHSRVEAEDLTEETFFRVWQKSALFNVNKGSFKTWLFRLATHLAINKLRKRARRESLAPHKTLVDQEVEDLSLSPETMARTSEARRLVRTALSTLSEKDQAVLVLRHLEGLGEEEVARILRIPRGTVKSRTYYAVRNLRGALESLGLYES